ncbi:hypothetical protein PsorP6_012536 [Peronosclerospora sorghi]|uniref:Uncharacterized protein n=1 Tax=Peronosclerospora sorghi TaxID=230839 RepID=A0ACC0WFE9_9STRA|nr:hypothetical protein PsorP6_012536 [Peronosclerospora sorghi]
MKLRFVFLVVASTLGQSEGLALAVHKSNLTNASEVQRHLRDASTIEPYTSAVFLPQLEHFKYPYDAFKEFMSEHLKDLKPVVKKEGKKRKRDHTSIKNPRFESLFSPNFRITKQAHIHPTWIDVTYYLAVLELADGSTLKAASMIHKASKRNDFNQEIVEKMQHGQFLLWSTVVESVEEARRYILRRARAQEWSKEVSEQYKKFLEEHPRPEWPGEESE